MSTRFTVRRLATRVLQRFNPGDIRIKHHYTGDKILIHSFKHKNYWFRGKKREEGAMRAFQKLVRPGDFVIEVGGHIGYITLFLSHLVGEGGRVVVFEPGVNNLPYLTQNIAGRPNVTLIESAVADFVGRTQFHLEELTGQNNSMLQNYRVLDENVAQAGLAAIETRVIDVACTTLDHYLEETHSAAPSFVKIDVEGAESMVLHGMGRLLDEPAVALMVEVSENPQDVFDFLEQHGYRILDESGAPRNRAELISGRNENYFCLKQGDPRYEAFLSSKR